MSSRSVLAFPTGSDSAMVQFVAEQTIQPGAFLFQSTSGRAMHLRTATARLKKHGIPGFHAMRRHRITRLRELGTPEDIVRFWSGHAGQGITDRYSKLAENIELRKEWALRAGLGFSLDHLGNPGDPHVRILHKPQRNLAPVKTPRPRSSSSTAWCAASPCRMFPTLLNCSRRQDTSLLTRTWIHSFRHRYRCPG